MVGIPEACRMNTNIGWDWYGRLSEKVLMKTRFFGTARFSSTERGINTSSRRFIITTTSPETAIFFIHIFLGEKKGLKRFR
jgi:hypothetical protein